MQLAYWDDDIDRARIETDGDLDLDWKSFAGYVQRAFNVLGKADRRSVVLIRHTHTKFTVAVCQSPGN